MSGELTVSLSSESLDFGSPEERATFGLFAMTANGRLLTAGEDVGNKELRHGPYVSGYPIAEWLVWNWWRIRWETGRPSNEDALSRWEFAHRMSTIGEGYAWPNITIFSDGVQSFLDSQPSSGPESVHFPYFGAQRRQAVPAVNLEAAIDGFVDDVLNRLEQAKVHEGNLHCLWRELQTERENPELTRFRRLEAQLGHEPGEADEGRFCMYLNDATKLGEEALGEIAADAMYGDGDTNSMIRASNFAEIAEQHGFEANPKDAIKLNDMTGVPQPGQVEAWRLGERCAKLIRDQENRHGLPIDDRTLTAFAGTTNSAISGQNGNPCKVSFALDGGNGRSHVWLRSRWETGRRFDLARLIGDRLLRIRLNGSTESLLPVTRASTYRQKMQRAFAAELLSPFADMDDMMSGDYSEEKQNEVAEYFKVSSMTIQTQLVNHHRIDPDDAPDIVDRSPAL